MKDICIILIKIFPTTAIRLTFENFEQAIEKKVPEPPNIFFLVVFGVVIVSYATVPTTNTDILFSS